MRAHRSSPGDTFDTELYDDAMQRAAAALTIATEGDAYVAEVQAYGILALALVALATEVREAGHA